MTISFDLYINVHSDYFCLVKSVRKSDEGVYECQISTQNKMSHLAYLKVSTNTQEETYSTPQDEYLHTRGAI